MPVEWWQSTYSDMVSESEQVTTTIYEITGPIYNINPDNTGILPILHQLLTKVDKLMADSGLLETQMAALEAVDSQLAADVTAMGTKLGAFTVAFGDLQNTITALQAQIAAGSPVTAEQLQNAQDRLTARIAASTAVDTSINADSAAIDAANPPVAAPPPSPVA